MEKIKIYESNFFLNLHEYENQSRMKLIYTLQIREYLFRCKQFCLSRVEIQMWPRSGPGLANRSGAYQYRFNFSLI